MRCVIQRVSEAECMIVGDDGTQRSSGRIGQGFVVLVATSEEDSVDDIDWLTGKIVNLRVMPDDSGVMNRSIMDTEGEILVVSQFTLWASYKKGNRPSYLRAGNPVVTRGLYEQFCATLEAKLGKAIHTGEFGADMKVSLTNDGPVTICMDTKNRE